MITVRYPNGLSVQYNSATVVKYYEGFWTLYTNNIDNKVVASIQVSAGATVEFVPACKVYNPTSNRSIKEMVDAIAKQRTLSWNDGEELRRLKLLLQRFDSRKRVWKDS